MGLYSFSKNAWHVRFFKWLFNEDPTYRYKTMCPYFWTYVLIFLFIVPILIVKMFGRAGTTFLSWVKDYKYNKERRIIASLGARCANPNLTDAEAYAIYKSKCWDKYRWDIDYHLKNKIYEMYEREDDRLRKVKRQMEHEAYVKSEARKEKFQSTITKFEQYRENKVVNFITYLFAGALLLLVAGVMIYGIVSMSVVHMSVVRTRQMDLVNSETFIV